MRFCAICKRKADELGAWGILLHRQMPSIGGHWDACQQCIEAAGQEKQPERGPLQLFEDEEEAEG